MSFAIVLSLCLALPIISFAGQYKAPTYTGAYTQTWSKYENKTFNTGGSPFNVRLTYGYNKVLINEDTATSFNNGYIHRAQITNPGGTQLGPRKPASDYSDLEIQHRGTPVSYYTTWED